MNNSLKPAIIFYPDNKRLSVICRNLIELLQDELNILNSEIVEFMYYEIGVSEEELLMIYEESDNI